MSMLITRAVTSDTSDTWQVVPSAGTPPVVTAMFVPCKLQWPAGLPGNLAVGLTVEMDFWNGRGLVAFKKHLFPKSECLWRLRLQKNRWSRTDRTKVFPQNPPLSLKKHHSQACRLDLCHSSGTSFRCCARRACSGPQTEGWMARCFRDW